MKKLLFFVMALATLTACNQTKTQEIQINEFNEKAPELVGKNITISGIAKHVCHNSGRKLFLGSTNGDSDAMVTVMAGPDMQKFDVNTEGKTYKVNGIVQIANTIDEAYLDEWEKEVMEAGIKEGEHVCATEAAIAQQAVNEDETTATDTLTTADTVTLPDNNPQLQRIQDFRKKIIENGGQPLVFYKVDAKSFEILDK